MKDGEYMLQRKIENSLLKWKNSKNHKSLMVFGARQVGKTYSIRSFGNKNYESVVEINFAERPDASKIFDGNLDSDTLLTNISADIGYGKLIPHKTLIFLDEIQDCPNAVTSLKFWNADKRYDVIATGSMLGLNYKFQGSYPVGNVEYIDMHSLDFEEFLWAIRMDSSVISELKKSFEKRTKVNSSIHEKMISYLKKYMILGGMPEVINAYLETGDLSAADSVQKRLYRDYIMDIAHYAPAHDKIKAEKCYRSIPGQLNKDNHKFQYSIVESKGTANKFGNSVDWLKNSFYVTQVFNVKRIEFPLENFVDETNFRLYPTDIGLLIASYDYSLKKAILEDTDLEETGLNIIIGTAKGGLYEALAADMLSKNGHKDIYFYKDVKSTAELEFIIPSENGFLPIEIKAGKKRANSLYNILEKSNIPFGYKMSTQNVGQDDKKITLPMYMLMFV